MFKSGESIGLAVNCESSANAVATLPVPWRGPRSILRAACAPPEDTDIDKQHSRTPSPAYANYVLVLLSLVYVVNFIDRQILAMLIVPIKEEFGVSDTALGLLSGFAFALLYTLAGIPIARWADRGSRTRIIALALTLWSAVTAACGLARSFVELALLRVLVGVGEAGGNPPSHSLIADYFPPHKRATALSIYAWGVYIGSAIAFLAGGYLVTNYSWRTAFFVVGLPGLFLAAIVALTVRELPRGTSEQRVESAVQPSFPEVLRHLLRRRAFVYIVLGASVQSLSGYGVLTWGPTFLHRVHEMPWTEIGTFLGWIIGLAGCLGAYAGGRLADRFGARDASWYMRLPALQSIAGVPFVLGFALLPQQYSLLAFIPFYALGAMYVGPMFSMVQGLVPLRMRATASALLLFVVNLIGLGLGPLSVGVLNDYVFGPHYGELAIRYSMLVIGLLGGTASLLFWQASRTLAADLALRED
ncbi:MAG: MFS transporter [Gammaproteobacteria bacterium]|nr:MFS transporter [Gammaproteobacteria bacterium]